MARHLSVLSRSQCSLTRSVVIVLVAVALILSDQTAAQTFTTLHPLGGTDGGQPLGTLTLSGSTLYGTAVNAGSNFNAGTVFAINSDGTGFRVVHTFNSGSTDGARPSAGVLLSGNRLFGTTAAGGASGLGTVFGVNTDGTGFSLLHSFAGGGEGADPEGDLILSGNTLYGTARYSSGGNTPGDGIVFAVNSDGTGFRIVHSFTAATDGAQPVAGLVLLGNILFGTASTGGNAVNGGTVFAVNTDGTGFFVLHPFGGIDGFDPESGLTLSGSTLFGTTVSGGLRNASQGTIFAVNTDGTGFQLLHSLVAGSDGSHPRAGLTLSGNTLYGTTTTSGPAEGGTIFSINTDGTKFAVLHPFTFNGVDGFNPGADVLLFGNALFGTTEIGGTSNAGTVFGFSQSGILSPLVADSTVGQLFVYQIVADNKPTSYDAFGLPPDLTIDNATGIISGIATQAGSTFVTISATGASGTESDTLNINIKPQAAGGLVITSTNSATGRPGQFFAFQVLVHGASAAARASATGLPTGLQIDDVSGLISGTPASSGSFAVNITITDGKLIATQTLELTFTSDSAIPVITSPSTAALIAGQPFSYTIVAPTVAPPDQTVFSVDGALPAGLGLDPDTGVISGTPQSRSERLQTLTPLIRALDDTPVVGAVQMVAGNSAGSGTKPLVFVGPAPNPLFNISTRLQVGTNDNVLIGGFIISGTEAKRVVLRAIGPSLANPPFNLSAVLGDPTIQIFSNGAMINSNDNWQDSQKDDLIASGFAPSDALESAELVVLNPGAYTAIVRGKSNTTGVGLVELFDLTPMTSSTVTNSAIANISTRGFVQNGDNVMIGGFIVGPNGPGAATVLVRAIGPSLANPPFNLSGVLADPTLELHDGSGTIIFSNDNWKDSQQSDIQLTGLAPTNNNESALIVTLTPGGYTAIVRGKSGATGLALVEVYALQ